MTAFRATYSDWKLVKTRGVIQVVFELPLHDEQAALEVLGGMPKPSQERWFGIAALAREVPATPRPDRSPKQPQPDGAKRDWRDLPAPQQAGIRINEPTFAAYLKESHPDEWHETGSADACLKLIFRIESKTELRTDPKRAMLWRQMDDHYQAWKQVEHA